MKTITLQKLMPEFLEEEKIEHSDIWNKRIIINKGEKLQIIAPSGRGKTSLIHFLYGLRKDYTGDIYFENKNIKSFSTEDFAEYRSKNFSIIFQDLRLFPAHSANENINIKRLLKPFYPASNIREMAQRLGIASKLVQRSQTCSYGEQQRIAIIRALQQPFDFLLMDEPFSHLDDTNREKAMGLIEEEAAKRNAAIILADLKPREYFKAGSILLL